nr:MAG TPA: hypothetical protein [Bacteriophage sp.]
MINLYPCLYPLIYHYTILYLLYPLLTYHHSTFIDPSKSLYNRL